MVFLFGLFWHKILVAAIDILLVVRREIRIACCILFCTKTELRAGGSQTPHTLALWGLIDSKVCFAFVTILTMHQPTMLYLIRYNLLVCLIAFEKNIAVHVKGLITGLFLTWKDECWQRESLYFSLIATCFSLPVGMYEVLMYTSSWIEWVVFRSVS